MRIGTIKQIWRYPVKSMAGEQLEACSVGLNGIPGDRGWAIRDETADMRFPGGLQLGSDAPNINARLTELLGKPVSLWPLQPASNAEHYRRRSKTARLYGRLARFRAFRAALPLLTSFGPANAELRESFSREPDEPIPDLSTLPAELFGPQISQMNADQIGVHLRNLRLNLLPRATAGSSTQQPHHARACRHKVRRSLRL